MKMRSLPIPRTPHLSEELSHEASSGCVGEIEEANLQYWSALFSQEVATAAVLRLIWRESYSLEQHGVASILERR